MKIREVASIVLFLALAISWACINYSDHLKDERLEQERVVVERDLG